jgi:hypothetical protein
MKVLAPSAVPAAMSPAAAYCGTIRKSKIPQWLIESVYFNLRLWRLIDEFTTRTRQTRGRETSTVGDIVSAARR